MKHHTIQIATTLALLTSSAVHAQQAVQWKVSDGGNGHWYLLATQGKRNWIDARSWASSIGGHLATFQSKTEWDFIWPRFNGSDGYWIGLFQDPPTGLPPDQGWRWVTEEPLAFTAWAPGEPNDWIGYQQWVVQTGNQYWDDTIETGVQVPVIEWDADCNNDGIVDYGQILSSQLADANTDGIPDTCQCGTIPSLPGCCIGDLDHDGEVGGADIGLLLSNWGPCGNACLYDLNNDEKVNGGDLGLLLSGWGPCPAIVPTWATLVEAMPDPAVVTDSTLRAAITASRMAWRVRDTTTQMEMLLVPAGTFTMGCTASNQYGCNDRENPTHSVTLTQAFYLGRYEVTQAQWVARMGSNPSTFQGASFPDAANHPVEQVTWAIVQGYLSATGMRLPSEAEWEYACRAGTTTAFNNGSSNDYTVGDIAWYNGISGNQTHAVGGKAANALGLHDMAGNVWEWVNDWYGEYSSGAQTNPLGPVSGTSRVFRGGSWLNATYGVRSSYRWVSTPGYTYSDFGFRVARNP
jgi:formylglycine-generating enzyme required for sulfatase activity